MFGVDGHGLLRSGSDESSSCQVVCFSEESTGSLMYGSDGRVVEEIGVDPCDGEVVLDIFLHLLSGDGFHMASGDDSRCKGHRGLIAELVYEI